MQTPRTEFAQALKAIATERGLDPEVILDTIKQAIIAAYKRDAKDRGEDTENLGFDVELDPGTGEAKIFAWTAPIEESEEGEDTVSKIFSQKTPDLQERHDVTPPGFGRIAAQTAKQVIHQKIREAEKTSVMDEFGKRVGTLVSGIILRFDGSAVKVDIGRTEAILPTEERIPNERLNISQRATFLIKEIKDDIHGKEIILSRADPDFVVKLFAREVPEVSSKSVEIKGIAREPGVRTKMTVYSNQQGVDPVGSCVGQKGVRVQAVTNELGGERVDVIPYSEDMAEMVKASLSPAENLTVTLDEKSKTAHVKAPEDQLSLAIGRDGQNARLSAKLTGWRIEVEAAEEAEETVVKEEKDGALKKEVEKDKGVISGKGKVVKSKKTKTAKSKTKIVKKIKKSKLKGEARKETLEKTKEAEKLKSD